jgi:hypothetical protein
VSLSQISTSEQSDLFKKLDRNGDIADHRNIIHFTFLLSATRSQKPLQLKVGTTLTTLNFGPLNDVE